MASSLMLVAFFLPLALAVVIRACDRVPNLRDGMTMVFASATFACVAMMLPEVLAGGAPSATLALPFDGLSIGFRVEPLGMLFALVASGLWIPTSLYAFGYMRGHHEENQTRFFMCFALAIFAALGIAFSANLLTLFLFYELLTFSTWPLVTHHQTEEARSAGRVYLGVLVFTSVTFLLLGIVWTYVLTGTLDFENGGILAGNVEPWMVPILLGLFAFGTGKAALMPFHRWLPNAMVAPTPVSALLHAVAVVKAGVFTVLKVVVYVFGIDLLQATDASDWLKWVAAFTIVAASVIAITQDNLKARLAYSTISQLAYIVLGAALATSASVIGGGLHIAMHAVGKITLFFVAGTIMVHAHKKKVSELDGLGRRMPFTFAAFFVGSLSIIGLPPTGGSWSKWFLALGATGSEGDWVFVGVLMLSSLLSIAYLMPVVARGFFLPEKPDPHHAHRGAGVDEGPLLCVGPLVVTALGCLAMFFLAEDVYALLQPMVHGGVP
ncbi:MAG TPA: monovalent cation/H+ antiporter subunit D family protein [Myxococcota bacterium]|nr:monovalent cation/H+ antiporter subunit D family protein [Myxococcota bacterium]